MVEKTAHIMEDRKQWEQGRARDSQRDVLLKPTHPPGICCLQWAPPPNSTFSTMIQSPSQSPTSKYMTSLGDIFDPNPNNSFIDIYLSATIHVQNKFKELRDPGKKLAIL